MSIVSTHLGQRRVQGHESRNGGEGRGRSLADLRPGDTARIVELNEGLDPATSRRLFDLGFAPGAPVELVRKAPMADPVVFRVAGYDVALRRVQARCIHVTPPSEA